MTSELRGPPTERSIESLLSFGVLNLDKPPGPTAHQVSAWVRDLAGIKKAAHAGTLDPKVTGCLPIMLGDATRIAQAMGGEKSYVTVLEFHGDTPADLESVLASFEGPIYQKPPHKSAVKRDRRVRTIFELSILEIAGRNVLLSIRCEAGTYIRKLCHDLGLALGTGANMGDLRRTATGPFDDTTLVTLHDFVDALAFWQEDDDDSLLREMVLPAEQALQHLPSVTIAPSAAREVKNGAPVYAPGVIAADTNTEDDLVACHTPDDAVVCLGRLVGDPDADQGTVVELERVLL